MGIKNYGGNWEPKIVSGRSQERLLPETDTDSREETIRRSSFIEYEPQPASGDVRTRGDWERCLSASFGGTASQLIQKCKERLAQNNKQIELLLCDNAELEKTISQLEEVTRLINSQAPNIGEDSEH